MDDLSFWLNFEPLIEPSTSRPSVEAEESKGTRSKARHRAGRNGQSQATAISYSSLRRRSDGLDKRSLGSFGNRYQPRHRTEPLFELPTLPELPHLPALPSPRIPHPASLGRVTQPALFAGSVAAVMAVTSLGLAVQTDGNQTSTELAADRNVNERAARSASLEERYPGIDLTAATSTPTTAAPTTTTTTAAPTTTTTAAPKPMTTTTTAAPKPKPKDGGLNGDDVWTKLAQCEAGGRNDGGAPYYGYFQFSSATWKSVGGTGLPNEHSYETQKEFAKKLQERSGWGQWPSCSSKLGLR